MTLELSSSTRSLYVVLLIRDFFFINSAVNKFFRRFIVLSFWHTAPLSISKPINTYVAQGARSAGEELSDCECCDADEVELWAYHVPSFFSSFVQLLYKFSSRSTEHLIGNLISRST